MGKIDFQLPTDTDEMLVVGAIFSEATTGANASDDEKRAIGQCVLNMAYYARMTTQNGKKCFNTTFGDGTIIKAIKTSVKGYDTPRWRLVMNGDVLKTKAALEKDLDALETAVLKNVVSIAAAVMKEALPAAGPSSTRVPLQFNQAANDPPSKREEKIFNLGSHTFYGFIAGRECQ